MSIHEKCKIIKLTIEKFKFKNFISYFCKISGISRSGYYNYNTTKSAERRKNKAMTDEIARDNILKVFKVKNKKVQDR